MAPQSFQIRSRPRLGASRRLLMALLAPSSALAALLGLSRRVLGRLGVALGRLQTPRKSPPLTERKSSQGRELSN